MSMEKNDKNDEWSCKNSDTQYIPLHNWEELSCNICARMLIEECPSCKPLPTELNEQQVSQQHCPEYFDGEHPLHLHCAQLTYAYTQKQPETTTP